MKKAVTGFFMSWGMFCAIPCPLKLWSEDAKLLSVVFIPFIGAVIGLIWSACAVLLRLIGAPQLITAALLTICPYLLSGFIHLDGFMDCCDAILSRRDLAERQPYGCVCGDMPVHFNAVQLCRFRSPDGGEESLDAFVHPGGGAVCVGGFGSGV